MFNRLTSEDIVTIARTLSLLIDAGVPLHTAIASLRTAHVGRASGALLARIQPLIEGGQSLHASLETERSLGPVVVALVQAGERSGTLPQQLTVAADWVEREQTMRNNITAATLYPKIIFGASLIVATGLVTFILPHLIPLFAGMHTTLPIMTRILIAVSTFMGHNWRLILISVGVATGLYVYLQRLPFVRYVLDRMMLHVPYLGALHQAHQLTISARVIATLYESGVGIPEALHIASGTCTNEVFRRALTSIAREVERGETMSSVFEKYPDLFHPEFILLTSVGEQSGKVTATFRRLSAHYEEQINTAVKQLPAVIEPVLLIFMTALVGFVAISIVLPIYEYSSGFTR
jgi:type IV pilus assembly protein PilC